TRGEALSDRVGGPAQPLPDLLRDRSDLSAGASQMAPCAVHAARRYPIESAVGGPAQPLPDLLRDRSDLSAGASQMAPCAVHAARRYPIESAGPRSRFPICFEIAPTFPLAPRKWRLAPYTRRGAIRSSRRARAAASRFASRSLRPFRWRLANGALRRTRGEALSDRVGGRRARAAASRFASRSLRPFRWRLANGALRRTRGEALSDRVGGPAQPLPDLLRARSALSAG